MKIDYRRIGRHFRAARQQQNLKQKDIAELLGVSVKTYSSLTTTDWEAVVDFLGMKPILPGYLPEGWRAGQYYAVRFDDELILNISYINDVSPTATMIFLWDHYFSVEAANLALEQNKEGELMEINGIRVYRSSNMEKNRFVWIEGKSVYSLTTTCDEKEIEAIISSFGE